MGVGGAGNNAGELLIRDPKLMEPIKLEYGNGIWVYKNHVGYCVAPVIETTNKSLIHHVLLYNDEDGINISNAKTNILCNGLILEKPENLLLIMEKIWMYYGNLNKTMLREELNEVGELERTLRKELGDNYRRRN